VWPYAAHLHPWMYVINVQWLLIHGVAEPVSPAMQQVTHGMLSLWQSRQTAAIRVVCIAGHVKELSHPASVATAELESCSVA
jgi:hypothetical protein